MKSCAEQKPWAKEGRRWKVVGEGGGSAESKVPRHELVRTGGKMKCLHCPQSASTESGTKRLKSLPCWGPIVDRVAGFARKKGRHEESIGHLLCVSYPVKGGNEEGVIWCTICGAYAVSVARNLLKPCPGVATKAGRWAIQRLGKLWHPKKAERMEAPIPYLLGSVRDRGLGESGAGEGAALEEESGGSGVNVAPWGPVGSQEGNSGRQPEAAQGGDGMRGQVGVQGGGRSSSSKEVKEAGTRTRGEARGHQRLEDFGGTAPSGGGLEQREVGGLRENVYSIGGVVIGSEIKEVQTRNTAAKRSRFWF